MDFIKIEELVILSKKGDMRAKEEIAEEFKPYILNQAKKYFINGYSFEDIKSECYRRIFRSKLKDAIDNLEYEEHELVEYVFYKKKTLKEYASYMDMPYYTAVKLKGKILNKLKKLIGEENYNMYRN